ncbi:MAG TPA: rhodanese-like domain-containing protein [Hyphomicrobiaceae bacterium]|nr:rhodanese-like domain-containing protein [Hyphomicrobiaceae bacterium]
MIFNVTPQDARKRIHGAEEVAFLDVREAGQFGEGHPLFAVPCPYSRLELAIGGLVPRKSTPLLLLDAGDGVAQLAAQRLAAAGYADIAIVEGGAAGWQAAGLTLFKGVNVPSKTLGELVEHALHPPMIEAVALAQWQREGRAFRLFDARPPAEYAKMRVPGARCLPNGELAHRFEAVVGDRLTPVIVTCAGRTRGLIGAAGLRLAGIPNPVYALENGTQGWALAGLALERGNSADPFPELEAEARKVSMARADVLCRRRAIPIIDASNVQAMCSEPARTTYVFDVRSEAEAKGDPVAIAKHAPSGQLVQASDHWIGVRRARIVLADDTGLRAALAAFWLRQLGYDTCVVRIDDALRRLQPSEPRQETSHRALERVSPAEALSLARDGGGLLLDLRASQRYRAGHAAGAQWSIRPRLGAIGALSGRPAALFTDEVAVGRLAAIDLAELGAGPVMEVAGGFEAWAGAGLPVEPAADRPSEAEAIDYLWFVHDRHDGNLAASRQYLAWEQGLIAQLDPEERAEFKIEGPD